MWVRHFRFIFRDTGLRDTKESREYRVSWYAEKQKTPRNGHQMFPVEKRMNSEAAVHQKPLTQLPDSFDSPVIYGVRVETSNPYHLRYIEIMFTFMVVAYQLMSEKSSMFLAVLNILCFKFLYKREKIPLWKPFIINLAVLSRIRCCRRLPWRRCAPETLPALPSAAAALRRPERPFRWRCRRPPPCRLPAPPEP